MSTILMALSLGAISMIIVFISGMMSGDVRLTTLTLRCLLAFCVSSAAVYFLLMIFEMYDESRRKKIAEVEKELVENAEGKENSEEENSESENAEGNFQPINPNDIPQA